MLPIPKPHEAKYLVGNLSGTALSFELAKLIANFDGFICIISENEKEAARLTEEVNFFLASPEASSQDQRTLTLFPDPETLPYDQFSPHQDITSGRLKLLNTLPHLNKGALISNVRNLLQGLPPRTFLTQQSLNIHLGDQFDMAKKREELIEAGYQHVEKVYQPGEFAIRGSIMDIFPMGAASPFRLDFLDNEIDSIRRFDVDSQRSLEKLTSVTLLPAHEYPLDTRARRRFADNWQQHFADKTKDSPVLKAIMQGHAAGGAEYYLPLFFDARATLLDYLPAQVLWVHIGESEKAMQVLWQEINARFEARRYDLDRPALPPQSVFLSPTEFFTAIKPQAQLQIVAHPLPSLGSNAESAATGRRRNYPTAQLPDLAINAKSTTPLNALQQFLTESPYRTLMLADSDGRKQMLSEHLNRIGFNPVMVKSWQEFIDQPVKLAITVGPLSHSAILEDLHIVIITESALFPNRLLERRARQFNETVSDIKDPFELNIGDPVVHLEHGIARYMGLSTLPIQNEAREFLTLVFKNDDKLYVPMHALNLISRYRLSETSALELSQLGSDKWQKTREKVARKITDAAAELLSLYASRMARPGFAYTIDPVEYQQFAEGFLFEETPDQLRAINEVLRDMQSGKPMDRLLCGDVGFGKTEVAMRAAFIAVQNGKQVCILVPTTLLAEQHYDNFINRFANFAVTIRNLTRFSQGKDSVQTLKELAEGKVDIVIGTHKLLSPSVQFKSLGLVVIDEEHRFGVKDKEKLKALRENADILTMTATPIPRTLNLAFSELKDLSIIATPPAKRLSVKSFVHEYQKSIVREAVLREVLRGGQVYYLFNEVERMAHKAEELRALLPEFSIGFAHGQMPGRELEKVMADFYHNRIQLLLSSTIIESGIDVPNANTIIIERADKLGLAQLHQLRGRVGRSHHQAYAYFLTPPWKVLTPDAQKRLEAINRTQSLGGGFSLASFDLEIRGAGELLGENQSGNIEQIGLNLYLEVLGRAVKAIKAGQTPDFATLYARADTEIELNIASLIPEKYLPDVQLRLEFYKKIAGAETIAMLDDIQVELIDRFGLLAPEVKNLFQVNELKLAAKALGITRFELNKAGGKVEFSKAPSFDPARLIKLIQSRPGVFQLRGMEMLLIKTPLATSEERIIFCKNFLAAL